jgi:hypothetical protein
LSWFVAINSKNADAYEQSFPPRECHGVPLCQPLNPGQAATPNYYAVCESGHCQAKDVRTTSLSVCNDDSQCVLRNGTSCCGCGNGSLIAVSTQANVEQVFCAGTACAADCVSAPLPPGVSAVCSAGHCAVRYVQPDAAAR